MKNFSLNREEQKYFILNYKVENNQIIIYLANHKQYIIPYTLENEKKVLQKMRSQIINSGKTEKKLESMVSSCKMLFFYYLCIVLICIVSVPFGAIFSFLGFGLVLTPVIAFFWYGLFVNDILMI